MKKYILAFFGIALMFNAHAQNSKVISAWNYLRNLELMKGKTAIDEASVDESTSGKPKTWFYKGLIYQAIGEDSDLCKKNPGLFPGVLTDALSAYAKALDLDTKNEYKDKIQVQLSILKNDLYNYGAKGFNRKDYDQAYMGFSNDTKIDDIFSSRFGDKSYDTLVNFYTGLAALQSKKTAEAKKIFENMTQVDFSKSTRYQGWDKDVITYLVAIYKEEKDTAKSLEIIEKGIKKFPNDQNLVISELNIYLSQKKYDKAIETINTALAIKDLPDNTKKQILLNAGLSYEKMNRDDLAEKAYKDALTIDPKYFEAAYEIGAMYTNKAVRVNDTLNKLPVNDTSKYNKVQKRRNDIFYNKALPALERSLQLAPTDAEKKSTAETLRNLYIRIDNKEKVKEMQSIIDSIKQ